MENKQKLFAINLRKAIQQRGITAEKVACESGITKSTISRVLSGKISPTLRIMTKISDYFGMDIRALLRPDYSDIDLFFDRK